MEGGRCSLSRCNRQQFATNGEGVWWRCRSTEAKQAKSDRGAPYIYWGYSRWALASTIVALSQHGSKAGSCGRSWQVCSLVTSSSSSSSSSYSSSFSFFAAFFFRVVFVVVLLLSLLQWNALRGEALRPPPVAAPLLLLLPLLLVLLLLMSVRR